MGFWACSSAFADVRNFGIGVDGSTKLMPSKLRRHQKSDNYVLLWMALILGMNIPWGAMKRSIPSPSPSSLSLKRYGVFTIRITKSRSCEERHRIWFLQAIFYGFSPVILTRDSKRIGLGIQAGAPARRFVGCFIFIFISYHILS